MKTKEFDLFAIVVTVKQIYLSTNLFHLNQTKINW